MNDTQLMLDLCVAMLRMVVLVSLPTVLVAALVGLVVGLLQAVTQLQEQSLAFAVKFLAVAGVLAISIPWMAKALESFMTEVFRAAVSVR